MSDLKIENSEPGSLLSTAKRYRESGAIAESIQALERLLDISPGHPEALFWLAHQTKLETNSTYLLQLENLHENGGLDSAEQKSYVCFALGRVREQQFRWKEAYEFYLEANKQRKIALQLFNTDVGLYVGQVSLQKILFEQLRKIPSFILGSDKGKDLIFIVGLPRCGSTLIETILGMGNNVHSFGELTCLPESVNESEVFKGFEDNDININELSNRFCSLDSIYRGKLPNKSGIKIDKRLTNFYLLGLISRVWPAARIVHIYRDPLDQIFSTWRTRFLKGYSYSLELNDLVKVYIAYRSLMDFWCEQLGERIYHCKYEQLIADPVSKTKSLASFCGIPWSEKMVNPQNSRRVVLTASFQQVREPINDRSIGIWRHYSAQLKPYALELESAGIDLGIKS